MLGYGRSFTDLSLECQSPLMIAALTDAREVAELLVSRGAKTNARDGHDVTPLHYAARGYTGEVVEFLISRGADVNARGGSGETSLHDAARVTNTRKVAELLVFRGADICCQHPSPCGTNLPERGSPINSCRPLPTIDPQRSSSRCTTVRCRSLFAGACGPAFEITAVKTWPPARIDGRRTAERCSRFGDACARPPHSKGGSAGDGTLSDMRTPARPPRGPCRRRVKLAPT